MQFTAWKIPRKNDRVTEPFRGRRKQAAKGRMLARSSRRRESPKMADSLGSFDLLRSIPESKFSASSFFLHAILHANLTFKCRHTFVCNAWRTESKRYRPIYRLDCAGYRRKGDVEKIRAALIYSRISIESLPPINHRIVGWKNRKIRISSKQRSLEKVPSPNSNRPSPALVHPAKSVRQRSQREHSSTFGKTWSGRASI